MEKIVQAEIHVGKSRQVFRVQNRIRENQAHKIASVMQTSANEGMVLLDDFLYNLFFQKKISYQSMMHAAQRPSDLEKKIREQTYAASSKKKK